MAILILVIGVAIFGAGIVGQIGLARRRRHRTHPEDKQSVRIVLTIVSIIVGAWVAIFAISTLLHAHVTTAH